MITNERTANKSVITGTRVFGNLTEVHSLDDLIKEIPPELHEKIREQFKLMTGEIEILAETVVPAGQGV